MLFLVVASATFFLSTIFLNFATDSASFYVFIQPWLPFTIKDIFISFGNSEKINLISLTVVLFSNVTEKVCLHEVSLKPKDRNLVTKVVAAFSTLLPTDGTGS